MITPARILVLAICLQALGSGLFAFDCWARKPRLRMERVDTRNCKSGELTAFFVEIELEGLLRTGSSWGDSSRYGLFVGDSKVANQPSSIAPFFKTGRALHVAIVVQATTAYDEHLPQIREGALQLIRALPEHTRYSLLTYAWQGDRAVVHTSADKVVALLEDIEAQPAVELALVGTLQSALRVLAKAPEEARRVIVLVSDGINVTSDWDTFRSLGSLAADQGVAIYPVAFSPSDERGPLLNLGELAKRSRGTLRWAKKPDKIIDEFANLGRELKQQQVATYRMPNGCPRGRSVSVRGGGLVSNAVPLGRSAASAAADGGASATGEATRRESDAGAGAVIGFVVVLLAGFLGMSALSWSVWRSRRKKSSANGRSTSTKGTARVRPPSIDLDALGPGWWLIDELGAPVFGIPEGQSTIGGASDCDVVVHDDSIEAHHAVLVRDGPRLTIVDQGAPGGTAINARRLREKAVLRHMDRLEIGAAAFYVVDGSI